jgi:uncharacterized protein YcnI
LHVRRPAIALAAVVTAVVVAGSPAHAHVTITDEVEAGGIDSVTFAVPNERPDASTTSLEVQLPEDPPLPYVAVEMKPGWESEVTMRTLDEPVELFGQEVSEVVDTVRWTGGTIAPDRFDRFTLRAGPFPDGAGELVLPAVQTYDSGEEVPWIERASDDGEEPEHPAPVLQVEAAEADVEDDATASVEGEAASVATTDDGGTDALTVVALVLGLVGAALGGAALLAARR